MHEAKAICKGLGRQLFEPTQSSANNKVTALAKAKGITSFWIGIHDKTIEGEFTYESNGVTIGYKNWRPNEPNNYGKGEDCVHMLQGAWNDVPCTTKLSFVCERLPPKFLKKLRGNNLVVWFIFFKHLARIDDFFRFFSTTSIGIIILNQNLFFDMKSKNHIHN